MAHLLIEILGRKPHGCKCFPHPPKSWYKPGTKLTFNIEFHWNQHIRIWTLIILNMKRFSLENFRFKPKLWEAVLPIDGLHGLPHPCRPVGYIFHLCICTIHTWNSIKMKILVSIYDEICNLFWKPAWSCEILKYWTCLIIWKIDFFKNIEVN